MCGRNDFYLIWEFLRFGLTEKTLFQVILGLPGISIRSFLLVYADWEKGGVCLKVCMCVCFMTKNYWDMFFVVRSNDSFNFPLGWIKNIVTVTSKSAGDLQPTAQQVRVKLCNTFRPLSAITWHFKALSQSLRQFYSIPCNTLTALKSPCRSPSHIHTGDTHLNRFPEESISHPYRWHSPRQSPEESL